MLKVISRSAFGLRTVLQALVDSAVRLCAHDGVIYLRHGENFAPRRRSALSFQDGIPNVDRRAVPDAILSRPRRSVRRVEQISDDLADSEFKVADAQRMKMRSLLGVPLLRDGDVEGVFVLGSRNRVRSANVQSNWCEHLPIRRSSRSRMCGCSKRCGRGRATSRKRWRSRPRLPTC